jgi:hypothetical protein
VKRHKQVVCFCIQCEEKLPDLCAKCLKHPDRKPRVVEIYDAPTILKTNECGCVGFKCARKVCTNPKLVWRHPKADGTLGYKNHFCSPECVRAETAEAKKAKRVTMPCSCPCRRPITRPASMMKAKRVYFSPKCHIEDRVRLKAEARRREMDDGAVQAVACYSPRCCGAVTDHTRLPNGLYNCVRCNTRIEEPKASMSMPPRSRATA